MQELLNDAAKAGNLPDLLRFADGHALPTLVPNFGFARAAVRVHARLFTPAVVAPLLGGTGGRWYASTPPPQCPAVHRFGYTALMNAAWNGRHAIVEKLVVARADPNTQNSGGCALPPLPVSAAFCRRCWSPTVPTAPSGRETALHIAAYKSSTKSAVPLLVGGADQTITDKYG
jgi:hypothetical protein